uniref:Uncharacterized protein n=1 Tax=Romanomermis culicivorax TaxID=13658 RepID=A0A915HJM2_ROMCU
MTATKLLYYFLVISLTGCAFFVANSQITDLNSVSFHLENVKRSLEKFLGSNLDESIRRTDCLFCPLTVPEHQTVVNTFFEKDLSLSTLRRFVRRESILLSDFLADRLKMAVADGNLKFCDSFIDQELKFFQDDTLYFYKILIVKQANLSNSDGKLVEKFLLATIRYEIIFAQLPIGFEKILECLTRSNNSSSLDVNNNVEHGNKSVCFLESNAVITPEIWSKFVSNVQRLAVVEFKRQQKRKIDYVLNKTENNAFDYSLFNEKCNIGSK